MHVFLQICIVIYLTSNVVFLYHSWKSFPTVYRWQDILNVDSTPLIKSTAGTIQKSAVERHLVFKANCLPCISLEEHP